MSRGVFVTHDQVRLTGSPDVARFLAQCLYWSGIDLVEQRQGWFYKSREEWQAETWLSRYKQEKAREQLKSMGLLEEKRQRRNTGIRIWFRLNRALYNGLVNTSGHQGLSEDSRLTLDYDNEHWRFASAALMVRTLEQYPQASVEVMQDAIDGHLEFWMFKTQKQSGVTMAQLRGRFLTREKGFLVAMNEIGQKDRKCLAEDSSVEQNNSTNSDELLTGLSGCSTSSVSIDISIDTEDNGTIVPNYPYKAEIGTIVSTFTAINDVEYSDYHCVNNHDDSEISVENDESVEQERSIEPGGSLLPENLIDCPTEKHSTEPQDYVLCHPFIYRFVQFLQKQYEGQLLINRLALYGFNDDSVVFGLNQYIEQNGRSVMAKHALTSDLPFPEFTVVDMDDAILTSRGEW